MRKPTPHTTVMTRKTRRNSGYCQSLVISCPCAVPGPVNSRAKLYISGRRAPSDTRHARPKMAVGTEPSSRISLALCVSSPSTTPTAIPARTSVPMTSSLRWLTALTPTPAAGNTALSRSALTVLTPAPRSTW
jgi:hypothetical protein